MSSGLEQLHPGVAAPLTCLGESRARWCLLRDGPGPRRLDGDVDLLVHPRDMRSVHELLVDGLGFAELRAWGRRPHRFFVGDLSGAHRPLKLDVVTELAFGPRGELPGVAGEPLLARRVRDAALWVPDPADSFWALLLHLLLDRGTIRGADVGELWALAPAARGGESPLLPLIGAVCPPGWDAARLIDAVEAGNFAELLALVPQLRARWPGSPRAAIRARAWFRGGLRRAGRRVPRRAQQRGRIASNSAARSTG